MPQRRRSESGAIIGLLARLEAPARSLAANDVRGREATFRAAERQGTPTSRCAANCLIRPGLTPWRRSVQPRIHRVRMSYPLRAPCPQLRGPSILHSRPQTFLRQVRCGPSGCRIARTLPPTLHAGLQPRQSIVLWDRESITVRCAGKTFTHQTGSDDNKFVCEEPASLDKTEARILAIPRGWRGATSEVCAC